MTRFYPSQSWGLHSGYQARQIPLPAEPLNRTILEVGVEHWIRQGTRPLVARLSYRLEQLLQQGLGPEGRCGVISDMRNETRDKFHGHITVFHNVETHPGVSLLGTAKP